MEIQNILRKMWNYAGRMLERNCRFANLQSADKSVRRGYFERKLFLVRNGREEGKHRRLDRCKRKERGSGSEHEKWKKNVLRAGAVVLVGGILLGIKLYGTRIKTIETLEQLTDYEDYNLYQMDVKYAYDLDRILAEHITDDQSFVDAVLKEALPHLPVHIKVPDFGCSAFTANGADGTVRMGRNYDFRYDTSALMVHCHPKNGYESIALLRWITFRQMMRPEI